MKDSLKDKLWDKLAINIGDPGDMVTGSAFQTFACDTSRAFLTSLVRKDIQEEFSVMLLGLCATVKVINSQKRKVNVERLKELARETYVKLVQCFPWCVVSPSVHQILGHSSEVIQGNDKYGLGSVSEEGLEALNKCIRSMREKGARKNSTLNNFTDTYNHLWDRSRPTIVEMGRKIQRRKEKLLVMSELEAVVESLFLEDANEES